MRVFKIISTKVAKCAVFFYTKEYRLHTTRKNSAKNTEAVKLERFVFICLATHYYKKLFFFLKKYDRPYIYIQYIQGGP